MPKLFTKLFCLFIDKENNQLNSKFENFISVLIVLNAINAGFIVTYKFYYLLVYFDLFCTIVYCFELLARYIACSSTRKFFTDPFQIFDIIIILCCLIPEKLILDNEILLCLRFFRLLRIFRVITRNPEMSIIVSILMKSVISLYRIMVFMLIFLYVFGVTGVSVFKLPIENLKGERQEIYVEFVQKNDEYFAGDGIDPFGSISESMFTLMKVISEQSWSLYRNELIKASRMKLIDAPAWFISFYFITWFIVGAYLLLNLVLGAILQNFRELSIKTRIQHREEQIHEKVEELITELLKDLDDEKLSLQDRQRLIQKAYDIAKR